jgi:drug/metabolite transporter (DMT)-like permease
VGAAGLRLLNPLVTTCAVLVFVHWVGSTTAAHALDEVMGHGATTVAFGCALAAIALALGAREFRRPSHDRMLDWLVVTLPVAAYVQHATWIYNAGGFADVGPPSARLATSALLLALGTALLIAGVRRRRHAPLAGFMGCVACLAVELRLAASLATEIWLVLCGLAALVAGVALDRYLRQPRNGLTSVALTDRAEPLDLLQTAGAALLAQHTARDFSSPDSTFTPGGGRFGGGGASGSY